MRPAPAVVAPAEAPAPPALVVREEEASEDPGAVWRAVVAELKAQKRDMLGSALAHGRVLSLSGNRVRLGYAPTDGMFRRQVERSQKEAEAAISKVLGRPMGLVLDSVTAADDSPGQSQSIAEEDTQRARTRDERIRREAREHPAVLTTLRLFGGTVEQIKVLEEEQEEFAPAPADDGEDAGTDDA